MITEPLEEATRAMVVRALHEVLGDDTQLVAELAENLLAITVENGLGVTEELLAWIDYKMPGKEWSAAEYRNWCARLLSTREQLRREHAPAEAVVKICESCLAQYAQRAADGSWYCAGCGGQSGEGTSPGVG